MQVEKILVQFPELGSNYLITLETVNNQDEMIVEVELSDLSTDNYIELEKIRKDITRQLKDEILVTPKVKQFKFPCANIPTAVHHAEWNISTLFN